MNKTIKAVTIGDIHGIGIRFLINLWKFKRKTIGKFILISNYKLFKKYVEKNNINLPYSRINNLSDKIKINDKHLPIFNIRADNNIMNTYNSIQQGYSLTKNKFCSSLITLPINKEKIIRKIDSSFIGHTDFLQKLDKKKYTNMIFYSKDIIVTTLTTHIPLNKINYYLKQEKIIYQKIYSLNELLKKDFNILNPKLVICGINPHAGENGTLGNEEKIFLQPLIKKLINNNVNIQGPLSPDTIFTTINRKKYDCFICIYHDQALIPFKLLTGFTGVNYTGSLDIIRTSPVHGTAYNLIDKKYASDKSLHNAFIIAEKIYQNRLR